MYLCPRRVFRIMNGDILKILLILVLSSNIVAMSLHSNETQIKDDSAFSSKIEKQERINSFICPLNDEGCCEDIYTNFKQNWENGDLFLTRLMENFRQSNCSHFALQCQNRTFAYTKFTSLVYDRFCDYETFQNTCRKDLPSWEGNAGSDDVMPTICQQVMMYNSSRNDYLEIITYYSPFCGLVWCGFDVSTAQALKVSTWTCLKLTCRVNIVIVMVTCGILAVITVLVNLTVLYVLWSFKKMSCNSQILYKFSLAVADLLVGLVLFPTCISTLNYRLVAQREIIFTNSEDDPNRERATFAESTTKSYLSPIGVFTTLSLAVSVFTLALAGFDRLKAIRDPLNYDKAAAATRAKWLLAVVWFLAFVLAILPLFTPGLYPYSLISGLLVATKQKNALQEYLIGIGIPFLAVWITIGAIYYTIKKQGKISKQLSNNSKATAKKERRVYKTLIVMLFAFTLSLAPAILALFAQTDRRIHEEQVDVYEPDLAASWSSFELFAVLLLMCNSLWNFFIYSYRDAKFRKMAKDKYKDIWRFLISPRNCVTNFPLKEFYGNTISDFALESWK